MPNQQSMTKAYQKAFNRYASKIRIFQAYKQESPKQSYSACQFKVRKRLNYFSSTPSTGINLHKYLHYRELTHATFCKH